MLGLSSSETAEWIVAIATAIGGIGAAVSAWFSWRSARAARDTAQEVRRAYAAGRRPDLRVSSTGAGDGRPYRFGVVIKNDGDVEAVDIDIVAEFVDGTIGYGSAVSAPTGSMEPTYWFFVGVEPVPLALVNDQGAIERVTVRFSDRERAGRWERVFAIEVLPAGRGQIVRLTSESLLFP